MSFTGYCSITQSLYEQMARCHMNLETGEDVPPEKFDVKKYDACLVQLNEHIEKCPQCALEEFRFDQMRGMASVQ